MDRSKFLELCKACAALPRGLFGMAVGVPENLRVSYQGIEYYPHEYRLGYNQDGTVRHTAVLHDLKANAVVSAELRKVEYAGD